MPGLMTIIGSLSLRLYATRPRLVLNHLREHDCGQETRHNHDYKGIPRCSIRHCPPCKESSRSCAVYKEQGHNADSPREPWPTWLRSLWKASRVEMSRREQWHEKGNGFEEY